ncbi:flagellin N-terminal helical domain-containing protein [Sandaracinobacteroides hominis]|uniref:flagellin N-terminal helical domain-containing protein n=1 Tax=Sandaracinobacteroides hominis TaxID=2780086 RepID=UPI0018F42326|nr:flagellin [Sandaracinobacteroides hominis]
MPSPVMVNSRSPIPVQAGRMGALEDRLSQLSSQMATGERFSTPSEEPAAANRAALLVRLEKQLNSDQRSLDRADSRLSLAETAVNTAGDALVRARELALSAANGTISAEERQIILREVQALQEQLLSAANARDEAGRHVFAGATSSEPAYVLDADGNAVWQGRGTAAGAEGSGVASAAPLRGPALFGSDTDGAFASLKKLADALVEPDAELRKQGMDASLGGMEKAYDQLTEGQARLGSARARLEVEGNRLAAAKLQTKQALAATNGLDMTAAVMELEALKLSLAAAQGAFSRVFDGTLFDRLG